VGSPGIAGKVREAGGDAAIVQSEEEAEGRWRRFCHSLFGMLMSGGSKTIASMVVIKYLNAPADGAQSIKPTAPASSQK
jgi:hypothetical protein